MTNHERLAEIERDLQDMPGCGASQDKSLWLCEQLRKAWEALRDCEERLAAPTYWFERNIRDWDILENIRAALAAEGSGDE